MKFARLIIDKRLHGGARDGRPCHMILPISFDDEGIKVEIIQCSVLSETAGCSLIRITDSTGVYAPVLDGHFNNSSLFGECSIIKIGRGQYMATVMNNSCILANIISQCGVFLTSAKPLTDDIIEWTVIAPNATYIKNMIERLKREGYGVERKLLSDPKADTALTRKQDEVMRYAFDNGYYEIPKKISIEELCEKFDCSKSTMSVLMRSAEKKVIEFYVCSNRVGSFNK